jgi:hypothetical protein
LKTRNWLSVILVLVLLAVYYIMGTDFLKQRRESQHVSSDIADVTLALAQIPPTPTDLEERLRTAEAELKAAQEFFPEQLNTTVVVKDILQLADSLDVKAVPMVTQPWMVVDVSGNNYSVFRLSVTATGIFTNLVSFIDHLESGEPTTLVIESAQMERPSETPEETDNSWYEVQLDIAVYARAPIDAEKERGE